ncbi:unnamed protein product [Acanthosepion pharaonis]|uniref:Uncharacterized protein n=1 Tax=Acanthosepion pharaonis TaxID=158019 RepID=A0A812BDV0_ACAPH|nr:unnamed protein product [Sepia pharaonis]
MRSLNNHYFLFFISCLLIFFSPLPSPFICSFPLQPFFLFSHDIFALSVSLSTSFIISSSSSSSFLFLFHLFFSLYSFPFTISHSFFPSLSLFSSFLIFPSFFLFLLSHFILTCFPSFFFLMLLLFFFLYSWSLHAPQCVICYYFILFNDFYKRIKQGEFKEKKIRCSHLDKCVHNVFACFNTHFPLKTNKKEEYIQILHCFQI